MNCKPGDLAIVVRSGRGVNTGKVCRVLHAGRWPGYWDCEFPNPITWMNGGVARIGGIDDSWLRPIRDQDGEDETLTWAGKPEQVTA